MRKFGARTLRTLLPSLVLLVPVIPALALWDDWGHVNLVFLVSVLVVWFPARRLGWDSRALWAALTSILFSLSMAGPHIDALAFVALVPFLRALEEAPGLLESFLYGLTAGFWSVFLVNAWAVKALTRVCELHALVVFPLFLGFIIFMLWKFPMFAVLDRVNRKRLHSPALLFVPASFAALEVLKFEMYPWFLGISQTDSPRAIQLVDIAGLPGLSFLIVLVNVAALRLWRFARGRDRRAPIVPVGVGAIVLLAALLYGEIRLRQIHREELAARHLTVAVVQPNSPYTMKKAGREVRQRIADTLLRLAGAAVAECSPDLMVFPEGAAVVGYHAGVNPEYRETYDRIARESSCPIVFDNTFVEGHEGAWVLYRGAILLSPDAEVLGEYHKHKMVPFGEYVPLADRLPFLRRLFRNVSTNVNYRPGTGIPRWSVEGVGLAPQMCFDLVYPSVARKFTRAGADLIVNIANDGWYGSEEEAKQHLRLGIFRCVENRVPMVRATNTGISAFVSATGRILGPVSPVETEWVGCREIPVPRVGSLYRRFGDVFGCLCGCFVGLALVVGYLGPTAKRVRGGRRPYDPA